MANKNEQNIEKAKKELEKAEANGTTTTTTNGDKVAEVTQSVEEVSIADKQES